MSRTRTQSAKQKRASARQPSNHPSRARSKSRAEKPAPADAKAAANGKTAASVASLPVLNEEGLVSCVGCGLCCSYVAVEIDEPNSLKRATQILWFLYHERISVYRDTNAEWYIQFETVCQHLGDDRSCTIYEERPHVCREYDEHHCEVNTDEPGFYMRTPGQFLDYLKRRRKKMYERLHQNGYLPPEETLDGRSRRRSKLPPFDQRLRRLRSARG